MKLKVIAFVVLFSLGQCDLDLPEGTCPYNGAPCMSDGRNGTCTNLYRCHFTAIAYKFINAGISSPKLPDICSYRPDGEPILCCLECSLDNSETMKSLDVMAGGTLYKNDGSVAWKKCFEYFYNLPYPCRGQTPYILEKKWNEKKHCENWQFYKEPEYGDYGGEDAKRWQFPHMALLGYGDDKDSAQWLCGGSVISEYYILTAAHCLSTPVLGNVTFVALGLLKRSDLEEYWKVHRVAEAVPHPEYKSPSKYHDIALLRMETEINFGRGLLPACLQADAAAQTLPKNGRADAAGWGRQGSRKPLADVLQVMQLHEYNQEECSGSFPPHRLMKEGYNHTTQTCFGRRDAVVDTCEGDSGGPLQTDISDCIYVIHGITSFGKDCGLPGDAGMYTRVKHYVPWIESVVWPGE